MADIQVPSIAAVTPAAADTVVGVQGGAVKRFALSGIGAHGAFSHSGTYAAGSLGAKAQGVVSVKDAPYSAVGDGTTDDTAAIQAAIDASLAAGRAVHFPSGTYRITATLTVAGPVDLVGEVSSGNMSNTGASEYGAEILVDGAVWGITIDCTTSGQDGPTVKRLRLKDGGSALGGVHIKRGINTVLDTVRCKNFPIGVQIGDAAADDYVIRLQNCATWYCDIAYKLTGRYCGSVVIDGGANVGPGKAVAGSIGVQYDATNGAPIWLYGCSFDSFETGAQFSGSSTGAVVTARFESCEYGVDIRARNIKIVGTYFRALTDAITFANSTASATERAALIANHYGSITGAYINIPAGFNRGKLFIAEQFPSESIGKMPLATFGAGVVETHSIGPALDAVVAGGGATLGSPTGMLGFNVKTAFPDGDEFELNTTGGNNAGAAIISGGGNLDFYTVSSSGSSGRTLDQAALLAYRRVRLNTSGRLLIGTATDNSAGPLQVAGVVAPEADNKRDLGTTSYRWRAAYATELRPGAGAVKWTSGSGDPNSVVTAPVGSLFTRTDGGAGTTLYVKETGTGNTGWVAK